MRAIYFLLVVTVFLGACKEDDREEIIIEKGTVTDIDGNVYQTVRIGNQWWMAENLKTTRFNDGTTINLIENSNNAAWENATVPSYSVINNGTSGFLYNGIVVRSEKNIAPEGWHIPSDEEWKTLERAIGMENSEVESTAFRGEEEANLLASKNSLGWPSGGELFGSNKYGFNAIPGGCRIVDGRINIFNTTAFWWAKDTLQNGDGWYRYIDLYDTRVFRQSTFKEYGMTIRCVKD
jgi:uncharacterized protein (TIGR02145 family)